jgi:hypothetical protein
MRLSWTYRWVAVLSVLLVASGMALVTAGEAWAGDNLGGLLSFGGNQAQFVVPTPACTRHQPDCNWMLFVNEPNQYVVVGSVTGDTGTLTITLPEFCGVVQADAAVQISGGPWRHQAGIRERLDACHGGSSTTTTTSTSTSTTSTTTTTRTTVAPTTTPSTAPPHVAAVTTSTAPGSNALPFTGATQATPGTGTTGDQLDSSQLPFTGADIRPMVLIGIALVLLGVLLITTVESRRRMLRRVAAVRMERVREGARRTSDWFLGL